MSKNSKRSVSQAEKLLFERVLSDVKPIESVGTFSTSGQEAIKISQRTENIARKNLSTQTKSKPSQKPLFLRNLLVITGKGRPKGQGEVAEYGKREGILKSIVPKWLDESPLRGLVLAFTTSQREHGGAGALYVLLRKN